MVDFRMLAETIKSKVFCRGISVDSDLLAQQLAEDEKRLRLYKSVFATEDGRWVLMDLMADGGLLSSHDTGHSLTLAHCEGKRAMAVRIASSLGLSFEQVVQMYADNAQ